MITKSYEINKINFDKIKLFLLYGKNEGLKDEITTFLIDNKSEILTYDEKEVLNNQNEFIENILTKSLFEPTKKVIIKRASDKLLKVVEEVHNKNLDDIMIIINADNLEKKSKLRSFFEKDKNLICIPFYPDNDQTLVKLAYNFLKEKKIMLSLENINTVVNKCNGDRENLFNELNKIENYCKSGKQIHSHYHDKGKESEVLADTLPTHYQHWPTHYQCIGQQTANALADTLPTCQPTHYHCIGRHTTYMLVRLNA